MAEAILSSLKARPRDLLKLVMVPDLMRDQPEAHDPEVLTSIREQAKRALQRFRKKEVLHFMSKDETVDMYGELVAFESVKLLYGAMELDEALSEAVGMWKAAEGPQVDEVD